MEAFRRITILVAVLTLALSATAFGYKKITVHVAVPPEVTLESEAVVAILDYAGYNDDMPLLGEIISNGIITHAFSRQAGDSDDDVDVVVVAGKKRGGVYITPATNDYIFIERSQLESALAELSIGESNRSGDFEESQIVALGGMVGADFVVYGSIHSEVQDAKTSKKVTLRNKKTKERYTVKVPCTKRTVSVSATQRIMDVETGQILATLQDSRQGFDQVCSNESNRTLATASAIAEVPAADLSNLFARQFLAHTESFEYELDKIKTKEFKKQAEQAANAADEYEIRRAYHIYSELYELDPYNPKVIYNLGVMLNFSGHFAEALKMFEMAQSLKKSGRYEQAIRRCQYQMGLVDHLEELDLGFEPLDLESEALAVASQKVKVKGSMEDRRPVLVGAEADAALLVRVPGSVELDLLGFSGDWFEVRLIDGRSGFIHRDYLKNPPSERASR